MDLEEIYRQGVSDEELERHLEEWRFETLPLGTYLTHLDIFNELPPEVKEKRRAANINRERAPSYLDMRKQTDLC